MATPGTHALPIRGMDERVRAAVGRALLKPVRFRANMTHNPRSRDLAPGARLPHAPQGEWKLSGHVRWLVAREALSVLAPMRPPFLEWTVVPLNAWNLHWTDGCWGRARWRYPRSGSGVWG